MALPRARRNSITSAAMTATTSAVHVGDVPNSRLAPMPATATWPMPSPMSDRPFCTRNTPMSGAAAPTTTPAISASCM